MPQQPTDAVKDKWTWLKNITATIMTIQSVVMFWLTAIIMSLTTWKILHRGGTVKDVTAHYADQFNIPIDDIVPPSEPDPISEMHLKETCKISKSSPACKPKEIVPCKK